MRGGSAALLLLLGSLFTVEARGASLVESLEESEDTSFTTSFIDSTDLDSVCLDTAVGVATCAGVPALTDISVTLILSSGSAMGLGLLAGPAEGEGDGADWGGIVRGEGGVTALEVSDCAEVMRAALELTSTATAVDPFAESRRAR